MIEVENLTKKYGAHLAVDHISFTISPGHVYGFLGPNGAGKSTTMNMITGCLAPTEGRVLINGMDILEQARKAKKTIGYLPEIPPLYPEMTPSEYLFFVGKAKGLSRAELKTAVEDVMERTGVTDVSERLIRNLSKGYRQRVGIAQAILGNPETVILDEPTVGLDPIQIQEIRELIRELGKNHTVILSSHILQEISAICDYVIMINKGRIVADDTLENLTRSLASQAEIRLETRGDEKTVRQILSAVSSLKGFEVSTSANTVISRVFPSEGQDVREEVFRGFSSSGIPILGMESGSRSLEEVFLDLVEHDRETEEAPEKEAEE